MASNVPGLNATAKPLSKQHPPWYRPEGTPVTPLKVLNSLTETVEPFTAIQGRTVKWYTCGPTVYDMSHMGHARAYLTFDILRRIMEDYFGYTIEYQMNITDIDDKIIKRARVNKLLSDYKAANSSKFDVVVNEVRAALQEAQDGLKKKAATLEASLSNATGRRLKEGEEQKQMLALKTKQLDETAAKIDEAIASKDALKVLAEGSGVMGEWLDEKEGRRITDHSIFNDHARKFEAEYFEDMRRLGVRDPDVISRVTEVVPQVIEFVKKIMDNGFAYVAESSVFFDTTAFVAKGHKYPKNLPTSQDAEENNETTEAEMAEGEGVLSSAKADEKRSPNDFALWKFSKPGEPSWDSPWGAGRPGWHIECSAMASEVLGQNMDIHAGGCDLKFPHHDNELAQSEAYWGHHQWVNYFLHCGHLHIEGLKMSKSLKNFITIRQALDELGVSPRQMRLLFLFNDWHKSMNFSDQSIGQAAEVERVLRAFFGSIEVVLRGDHLATAQGYTSADTELATLVTETENAVHEALSLNFDTVKSMQRLMDLVSATNKYLQTADNRPSATLLRKVSRYVTRILRVFGVIQGNDDLGFSSGGAAGEANEQRFNGVMDALVGFRDEVRAAHRAKSLDTLMPACDKIRDDALPPLGVRLEDKPGAQPTVWKSDDPQVLMKEIEAKRQAAAAARRNKLTNQLETKQRDLTKWAPYVDTPDKLFRSKPEFASKGEDVKYDDRGVPVSVAGAPIDDKQIAKFNQEYNSYRKVHDNLTKKGGAAFVDGLKREVADLQAALAAL